MLTKALIPLLAVASFACFAVAATAQGPLPPVACPSAVAVAHDAAIGQLPVPQGRTSSRSRTPARSRAPRPPTRRPDGRLPAPWSLNARTATFSRPGASFRVKPAS